MSVPKLLRLGCYYCANRIAVDFYAMGKQERAHEALRAQGWILGVERDGAGGVLFDPLCHECGRGVVRQMIDDAGGKVDPDAARRLRKIYPDLFE